LDAKISYSQRFLLLLSFILKIFKKNDDDDGAVNWWIKILAFLGKMVIKNVLTRY
jgi:hypothetical protein